MNRKYWKLQRIAKDITITEIAKKIGCSVSLISKYETNIANMDADKVKAYQEYITENKGVV